MGVSGHLRPFWGACGHGPYSPPSPPTTEVQGLRDASERAILREDPPPPPAHVQPHPILHTGGRAASPLPCADVQGQRHPLRSVLTCMGAATHLPYFCPVLTRTAAGRPSFHPNPNLMCAGAEA